MGDFNMLAMFEAVNISKWLPHVGEHTFASTFEELTAEEEAALSAATSHARGEGPAPDAAATAAIAGVAARLDVHIQSFGGAAFVKLGDRAPKDVPPPANLQDEWRQRLAAASEPRASNAGLAAFVWARSRSLRVTSGAEAVALLTKSERSSDEFEQHMVAGAMGGAVPPLSVTVRAWEDAVDPAYEFRCFVVRDKLVAASDMASHELLLHYPAVIARREELRESLSTFFRTHLQAIFSRFKPSHEAYNTECCVLCSKRSRTSRQRRSPAPTCWT